MSRLDATLLRAHLVDELRLWVIPVAAGAGQRLFEDIDTSSLNLKLTDTRKLANSSVILTYAPSYHDYSSDEFGRRGPLDGVKEP